jgi:hypothetical protein
MTPPKVFGAPANAGLCSPTDASPEASPTRPTINVLLWAFDRLSVDGGMTAKEQLHTMREIGKVLCGRPSPAATYTPNDWDESARLPLKKESVSDARDGSGRERSAACSEHPPRDRRDG